MIVFNVSKSSRFAFSWIYHGERELTTLFSNPEHNVPKKCPRKQCTQLYGMKHLQTNWNMNGNGSLLWYGIDDGTCWASDYMKLPSRNLRCLNQYQWIANAVLNLWSRKSSTSNYSAYNTIYLHFLVIFWSLEFRVLLTQTSEKQQQYMLSCVVFLSIRFFFILAKTVFIVLTKKNLQFFYEGAFRSCFIYFTKDYVNVSFIFNHSFEISNIIYINTWQGNILNRKNWW